MVNWVPTVSSFICRRLEKALKNCKAPSYCLVKIIRDPFLFPMLHTKNVTVIYLVFDGQLTLP